MPLMLFFFGLIFFFFVLSSLSSQRLQARGHMEVLVIMAQPLLLNWLVPKESQRASAGIYSLSTRAVILSAWLPVTVSSLPLQAQG